MAKVNKTYSLDPETFIILENYCASSDNWEKKMSRSKVVNDAIRWFITGDVAELVHANEALQERFKKAMRQIGESADSKAKLEQTNRPWWRRLLLGQ